MKTKATLIGATLVALLLTGCDVQTEEEIKETGRKAQVCKDAGGRPYMTGIFYTDLACSFTEQR